MSSSMIQTTAMQDPLLIMLEYLSVQDILSVSQTCQLLRQTCVAKQLWLHVWRRDILQKKLPRPKDLPSLDILDDSQMKALVIHTLRLHHHLTCPPARRIIRRVALLQSQAITWIRVICGTWLLVAMSDAGSSTLSLYSVRSLLGTRSQDLLAQAYLEGPVLNGLVDVTDKRDIIIALELHTKACTLEVLSVQCYQDSYKFVRLAHHDGISHIRALYGSSLGFALHEDLSIPSILDWRTGSVIHLKHLPDADGGVVAMTLDDDFVVYLTPRTLHVMKVSLHEEGSVQYLTIATFGFDNLIWHAGLALCRDDRGLTMQICISNSRGLYVYSVGPVTLSAGTQAHSRTTLLWSREVSIDPEPESPFRMITHPLFDQTSTTISWLESMSDSKLSRSLPAPVQFVTITERISDAQSPLKDPPCFELSERSMPALYAQSTRDYDHGLGLLAIGNMIGELALYSFGGDAFGAVQDALQIVIAPSWDGQKLLPLNPFIPYPPRSYSVAGPPPTDEDKQAQEDVWCRHWPQDLEVPKGWRRCSAFEWAEGMRFLDVIGNKAWELGNACHFLGRVIPLISNKDNAATLLTVGGLLLIFQAPLDLDEPYIEVLNPELSLEDVVARLPQRFYEDEMGDAVVNITKPDWGLHDELQSIALLGAWEQRHGINRWGEFKARGGKAVISTIWEDIREGPSLHDGEEVLCADECPICA